LFNESGETADTYFRVKKSLTH